MSHIGWKWNQTVHIRTMTETDWATLRPLAAEYFEEFGWPENVKRDAAIDRLAERLIAYEGEHLVALCLVAENAVGFYHARRAKSDTKPQSRSGHIEMLFIHPTHRRKGLGTQMVDHIIKRLQSLGAESLEMPVSLEDPGGQKFMESLDFEPTAQVMGKVIKATPMPAEEFSPEEISREGSTESISLDDISTKTDS